MIKSISELWVEVTPRTIMKQRRRRKWCLSLALGRRWNLGGGGPTFGGKITIQFNLGRDAIFLFFFSKGKVDFFWGGGRFQKMSSSRKLEKNFRFQLGQTGTVCSPAQPRKKIFRALPPSGERSWKRETFGARASKANKSKRSERDN